MRLYPIHLDLVGRRCIVVGAGPVAERRIKTLLAHGACVHLVAPEATPDLQRLAEEQALTWTAAPYELTHLDDAFLVIAATNRRAVNTAVACDARRRGLLVCCADEPADGNFVTPSQLTRGDLVLTVSTSGKSPTLAAVVRERLEAEYGEVWELLTVLLGELRPLVQSLGDENARRSAVRRLTQDKILLDLLQHGAALEAEARARECLLSSSE